MRSKFRPIQMITLALFLLAPAAQTGAQELIISGIENPGRIQWMSPSLNVTGRVEWASSPGGPWSSSWTNQQNIFITAPSNSAPVAMFYRVVYEKPDPHLPDITTVQTISFLDSRSSDSDFVIIDVRTAGEYNLRHIRGALNIDFYSPAFSAQLDELDKNKTYLIYCASGNRSGKAHDLMPGLGFHEVYNMLGGMKELLDTPGAALYLEP